MSHLLFLLIQGALPDGKMGRPLASGVCFTPFLHTGRSIFTSGVCFTPFLHTGIEESRGNWFFGSHHLIQPFPPGRASGRYGPSVTNVCALAVK